MESLKFKPGTQNIEMARHELLQLLANPMQTRLGERPKLVILLDGLNESSGETKGLLQEISELSQMQGVRKILGENGVLMPQQEALAELLPLPSWYSPETTGYLSVILAEDGSVTYPESGDNLADANYGIYIQVEGVSEEDIDAYMELAENYAEYTWKEEDRAAWYIMMTDYHVKIDWEDNTATILFNGEDITFAPVWYIRLQ